MFSKVVFDCLQLTSLQADRHSLQACKVTKKPTNLQIIFTKQFY